MKVAKRINATPDASLLEDIGVGNFTVAEAIAELVANSFDWRFRDEKIQVEILVSNESISIQDNGTGMTPEVLENAVVLSRKTNSITGRTASRKGMFGLGLKTACANLGKKWSVTTKVHETESINQISFDLSEWSKQSGNTSFDWTENMYELEATDESPFPPHGHGTLVSIEKTRDKSPSIGAIGAFLSRAYKGHLETGDVITINGERLSPPEFKILEGSRIRLDREIKDSDGQTIVGADGKPWVITGWAGLDFKTHNDDLFGFNLYREGQLVKQWDKSFFKVHLMTSRLIGEINLDFVSSNFQKKGFDDDSLAWKSAVTTISEALQPLVKASRAMSQGKDDELRQEKALEGLRKATGNAPQIEDQSQKPTAMKSALERDPTASVDPLVTDIKPSSIVVRGEAIALGFEITSADPDSFLWDYIYDESANELQAVINSESSIFVKAKDPQVISIIALADAVMKFLVIEKKIDFDFASSVRDKWIAATVSESSNGR